MPANLSKETQKATLEEIAFLIGEVENSKQIHLSEQEFGCLQYDLFRLNETLENLRKRGEAVKRNTDYGRLSLDVWLKSQQIYTEEEINLFVNSKINQRRKEFERLSGKELNQETLAKEGLIEVQVWWRERLSEQLQKHAERIDAKCKRLRAQFYKLSEQGKIDLWSRAVQLGIVKDGDKFAHLVLPMLVPQMIEDFELQIKKESIM